MKSKKSNLIWIYAISYERRIKWLITLDLLTNMARDRYLCWFEEKHWMKSHISCYRQTEGLEKYIEYLKDNGLHVIKIYKTKKTMLKYHFDDLLTV